MATCLLDIMTNECSVIISARVCVYNVGVVLCRPTVQAG